MSNNVSQPLKVFISYSWDSPQHKDNVLKLADRLRADGIDCNIDQYEESPPEGWPRWMRNQVKQSDFVLVVCTDRYNLRFEGREELGKGKGVTWEGAIISQILYDEQVKNTKFIPVIFSFNDQNYIPDELGGATRYILEASDGYEGLYRRLTNQHSTKKPTLGKQQSLPSRERQYWSEEQNDRDGGLNSNSSSIARRQDEEAQQNKLEELYNNARRRYKARQWQAVVTIFRQMQELNLPFYDPDGLYKLAYEQQRKERERQAKEQQKQDRKNQELENLYDRGVRYYKAKAWYEAKKQFKEILQQEPRYRDTERLLEQVQEKLTMAKWIPIVLIAIGWIISFLVSNSPPLGGAIGGLVSAGSIWWAFQQTEQSLPSKQIGQFVLFILIGIVIGSIIHLIIYQQINFANSDLLKSGFTLSIGALISYSVLIWHFNRQDKE